MNRTKKFTLSLLAVGVTGASLAAITAAGGAEPSSPATAESPTPSPLPAFERTAGPQDALPVALEDHLARFGQKSADSRKVASVDGADIYATLADGDTICLSMLRSSGVASSTCNAQEGLSKGWIYVGDQDGLVGLVDKSIARVTAPSGDVALHDGVYYVAAPTGGAVFSFVRADGSTVGTVSIPSKATATARP